MHLGTAEIGSDFVPVANEINFTFLSCSCDSWLSGDLAGVDTRLRIIADIGVHSRLPSGSVRGLHFAGREAKVSSASSANFVERGWDISLELAFSNSVDRVQLIA